MVFFLPFLKTNVVECGLIARERESEQRDSFTIQLAEERTRLKKKKNIKSSENGDPLPRGHTIWCKHDDNRYHYCIFFLLVCSFFQTLEQKDREREREREEEHVVFETEK